MDPASKAAERRGDSPACRVVIEQARADADDGASMRVQLLAGGAAFAATAMSEVLAGHRGMTVEEFLDSLDKVAEEHKTTAPVTRDLAWVEAGVPVGGGEGGGLSGR